MERNPKIQVIISAKSALCRWLVPANRDQSFGGSMAIKFVQIPDGSDGALEGIAPSAHPAKNQQSIRVIREEVDRIEWALKEILPR